ncbi:MAG: 4-(cytidine 5'-diphospho)-2-C-methyl-D-erythritol kinase [Firmicutes bacterium]|nr:4-(cytidine 5'-diphospho)-2-C-methyl-D-erythritol kinase [Bacillota bacterium]
MKVFAQAKVNLALDVVKRDGNGYHLLDMIMAPISLFDEIEISVADKDFISCIEMELPEINTISKTLKMLRENFDVKNHYSIVIHKNIPEQAGLAGGSADAAAVMKAVCDIENIVVEEEQAFQLSKKVGADVPFCYFNKWARVQGIGEIIQPIACDQKIDILLVKPDYGISTPKSFGIWDKNPSEHVDVSQVQKALEQKNFEKLCEVMDNALEPIAKLLEPNLEQVARDMEQAGMKRVMMSGSGSSMMGFCEDKKVLNEAKQLLADKYPFVEIVSVG